MPTYFIVLKFTEILYLSKTDFF